MMFGVILGWLAYILLEKHRRTAIENLTNSFPKKTQREIRKIARSVFCNQGRNLFQLLSFNKFNASNIDKYVKIEGSQYLADALKEGKGVIFLSAHIGLWELMGIYLSLKGFPINVIARRVYDERLNRLLIHLRASKNVNTILRGDSPRKFLQPLRKNEVLAFLIDQDTNVQGVFVDFLGRPAYTPIGLASIAMKTGAPVIPGFIVRMGPVLSKIIIEKSFYLSSTGNPKIDIQRNIQILSNIIEKYIKRYPDQWVWMHQRWKTKPCA